MKDKMQDLFVRLSNVGTIIAITSAVIFILNNCGILVDSDKVINIINGLCSIGVLLGFLNNPQDSGIYLPFIKDNLDKKKEGEE